MRVPKSPAACAPGLSCGASTPQDSAGSPRATWSWPASKRGYGRRHTHPAMGHTGTPCRLDSSAPFSRPFRAEIMSVAERWVAPPRHPATAGPAPPPPSWKDRGGRIDEMTQPQSDFELSTRRRRCGRLISVQDCAILPRDRSTSYLPCRPVGWYLPQVTKLYQDYACRIFHHPQLRRLPPLLLTLYISLPRLGSQAISSVGPALDRSRLSRILGSKGMASSTLKIAGQGGIGPGSTLHPS